MSAPALQLEGVSFRYGTSADDGWELSVPSLEVDAGEQVLLQGGSGSGKSTLLQLIAGLIDPTGGRVLIDGTDIHGLRGAARDLFRGRAIGMIFQTFNLLHGFSAVENVMVPMMFSRIPRHEHRSRALELLKHLGIAHPHRDPQRLSVGQQQRVAVARAIACGPSVVLADEPTASLDPENAAIATELIQCACRDNNAALVCVSHDPSMAERFSRVEQLAKLSSASGIQSQTT